MTTNDSQSSPNSAPVRKVRKAVLPAAGLGTRFLPATKAQPKEMLTVVDKPQIQYVAEECVASGIEHIIIVTGQPAPQPPFGARLLRIRDLVEKPKPENAPSSLAITGRYVLPPAIFDCLERTKPGAGNEIQLTDGLRMLAQEQGLWAYIYEGISYDAGDKLGFLKATVELALQNQELGADFRSYLKTLKL